MLPGFFYRSAAAKTVSKFVNTTAGKWLVKMAANAVGEGLEEVVSDVIAPVLIRSTYDPNAPFPTLGELMETFASSAALSFVVGGTSNMVEAYRQASTMQTDAAVRAATENVTQEYEIQEQKEGKNNVLSYALAKGQQEQRIAAAQAVADADNGQVNRQVQAQGQRSASNALLYDSTNAAAQNTRANNPLQAALDAEAEKAWYGNAGRNMQGENAADSSAVLKALPVPQSMQDNAGNTPSVGQVSNTVQQDGTEINSQKNMLKKIPGEDASVNVPVVESVMEKILSRKNSDGTITNDLAEENAKAASRITVDKNGKAATKKFGSVEQLQQRVALTGDKNGTTQLFTLSELIQRGTVTEQHARDITKQLSMTEIKLDGRMVYVPSEQVVGFTGAFTDINTAEVLGGTEGSNRALSFQELLDTQNEYLEENQTKSDGKISKNITLEDFEDAAYGKDIHPDVLNEISHIIKEGEDANEYFINDVVFESIPRDKDAIVLMQTRAVRMGKQYGCQLAFNTDVIAGKSLKELDTRIAMSPKSIANSLKEAAIHEIGHAKFVYNHRREDIAALYADLENRGVDGISQIAYDDGVECMAEVEILLYRGSKVPEEAMQLYKKYIGGY